MGEVPKDPYGPLDSPVQYSRPGPGNAQDGNPKFDVTIFDQSYFDRMRARVIAAGNAGIYVSIMMFNGWGLWDKGSAGTNPWTYHPFNSLNNINSIDGDPSSTGKGLLTHGITIMAILNLQKAYVAKVIDTVNDCGNVLYEICNEDDPGSDRVSFQNAIISYIGTYEAGKPKQHPRGMTTLWNAVVGFHQTSCYSSSAEWVSPNGGTVGGTNIDPAGNTIDGEPPVNDGSVFSPQKVVLVDTDHTRPATATIDVWVWKAFLHAYNVIHMDGLSGTTITGRDGTDNVPSAGGSAAMRRAMTQIASYAARCNLKTLLPHSSLISLSPGYCSANSGTQYLALAPSGGTFTVNLFAAAGVNLTVEWLKISDGTVNTPANVAGGSSAQSFTSPFSTNASVLFLNSVGTPAWNPGQLTVTPRVMWIAQDAVFSGSNLSSISSTGTDGTAMTLHGTLVKGTVQNSITPIKNTATGQWLSQTVSAWGAGAKFSMFVFGKMNTNVSDNGFVGRKWNDGSSANTVAMYAGSYMNLNRQQPGTDNHPDANSATSVFPDTDWISQRLFPGRRDPDHTFRWHKSDAECQ